VSGSHTAVRPPDGADEPHDDPLAADRRTIVIAVVVMIALVLVGVVSGSLFARSACRDLAPTATQAPVASDPDLVVAAAFPGLDAAEADELVEAVTELAGTLGPLTGIADASGGERLAIVDGTTAVVGTSTTLVDASGQVHASMTFDDAATVVGDGDSLYSLALVNPLTGQVDGLQPVDGDLEPGTCVDTALVGSPLAFHVAAGGGELALLRVGEDGGEPELELRDPVAGQVWAAPLELGQAPAGILGAWVTGAFGDREVLVGRRTRPGDEEPVLTAFARRSGDQRWALDRSDLGAMVTDAGPQPVEVLQIDAEVALVLLGAVEEPDGSGDDGTAAVASDTGDGAHLIAVDLTDGTIRWAQPLPAGGRVQTAALLPDAAWVAVADDAGVTILYADADEVRPVDGVAAGDTRLATLPDGRLLVASDAGIQLPAAPSNDGAGDAETGGSDDTATYGAPFAGRDVVVADGRVTLLLTGPDDGAVLATFGA
jgi:outer membrane protein assembly factor BamB